MATIFKPSIPQNLGAEVDTMTIKKFFIQHSMDLLLGGRRVILIFAHKHKHG
jgi:hypothetical protein